MKIKIGSIILLTLLLTFLLGSCTSDEQRAIKAVQEFIEATKGENYDLAIKAYPKSAILLDEINDFEFQKLNEKEIGEPKLLGGEKANIKSNKDPLFYLLKTPYLGPTDSIRWIVKVEEGNAIIINSHGIFKPNNCLPNSEIPLKIELLGGSHILYDYDLALIVKDVPKLRPIFNKFKEAVSSSDMEQVFKIYPGLKDYKNRVNLGDIITEEFWKIFYVSQNNKWIVWINCGEESFKLDYSYGFIIDSYNFISTYEEGKMIEKLGSEPNKRERQGDLTYIKILNDQKNEILYERERKRKIAKWRNQGAPLIKHSFITGMKDGNPTKGITFTVINVSGKEIKYVILELVGYNAVDDPVYDFGYVQKITGIGPVKPSDSATWNFENIWTINPNIVEDYEIKTLKVVYKDGSSHTTKLPETVPLGLISWL